MVTPLSPDIYFEDLVRDERHEGLHKVDISRSAFLGIAERGPIQEPTRIPTSYTPPGVGIGGKSLEERFSIKSERITKT